MLSAALALDALNAMASHRTRQQQVFLFISLKNAQSIEFASGV
jgi:hypothetical protein